jgi:hypothetical protein
MNSISPLVITKFFLRSCQKIIIFDRERGREREGERETGERERERREREMGKA